MIRPGDYYGWLAEPQEESDPWAPVAGMSQPQQSDPWSIASAPPPKPLDESPPATSAEMESIIQQSQGPGNNQPLATVNLNPADWMGKKKDGGGATAPAASNYAGWGRYSGGY